MKIKQQLVPNKYALKVISGTKNQKKWITIHDTGNSARGADAQAHANLQSRGNVRAASWHYQVKFA